MIARSPFPGDDLAEAVRRALHHEGHLFAAGEVCVLRRLLALGDRQTAVDGDALELFARLALRAKTVFRNPDYDCATAEAWARLLGLDLATTTVSEGAALRAFSARELRAACLQQGLRVSGPRAALEARLRGTAWRTEPVWGVGHRALLARVDRLGGYDRRLLPAERVVGWTWAVYVPTGGPGLYPDRRRLREHERARAGDLSLDEALAIARAGPPPWGPSAFGRARGQVLAATLPADELATVPTAALEHVRALEAEGRLAEAVARCRQGDDDPSVALALCRTGHRLARSARSAWPPVEPPRAARPRAVRLERAGSLPGGRPAWRAPGGEAVGVEAAVVAHLRQHGREALHAENWLWSSLFALVFRELYWMPVPGRLPTARRSGPVDLGTPAFYAARRAAADQTLARLEAGGLQPFVDAFSGEILAGLSRPEIAASVGLRLPGKMLCMVLSELLRSGFDSASGLPDLLVLPGEPIAPPGVFPSTVPGRAFLAEVKGPGDSLRDGQRVWIDRLVRHDIHVELWAVSDK